MTLSDLGIVLKSVPGMQDKVAYRAFPVGKAPAIPYITYLEREENSYFADNAIFYSEKVVDIELYTDFRDETLETMLENALTAAGLVWGKEVEYLDSEHCYMIVYTVAI